MSKHENKEQPATPAPPDKAEFQQATRAGFVGFAGAPNVGKSTLVNCLVGQKIAIVSSCPQTTRHRLRAIWTEANCQAVLVDVPGILETGEKFNLALVDCAQEGLRGSDLLLHVRTARSADSADEARTLEVLRSMKTRIWQVWNKADQAPPAASELGPSNLYEKTFVISAKSGKGVGPLKQAIREALPEGPWLYPEDDLSDRDMRFLASERVREKLFLYLQKELPYSVATWTEAWEERPGGKAFVRVIIQAERESHKRIIIGKGGEMLRKIGSAARREIEDIYGDSLFLELFVRVKPHWRRDDEELKRLGLTGGDRC